MLAIPAACEILLLYVSQKRNPPALIRQFLQYMESELSVLVLRHKAARDKRDAPDYEDCQTRNNSWHWLDLAAAALIFFVIYIPRTDLLAGSDFHLQSFHHWDFFAMGPAIGLLKGRAIVTQVYSQYGVGWPHSAGEIGPICSAWLWACVLKIAVLYGCVYYCGLYWLLRRLLTRPAWALAGVLIAARIQMFR